MEEVLENIPECVETEVEEIEEIRPNIFTKKEYSRIERNNEIRDMMIHKLLDNGQIPDDTRKIRLLKEILVEQDSSIHQVVGAKLKSKEMDEDSKFKSVAIELLNSIKVHTPNEEGEERVLEFKEGLSENVTPVEGHLEQGVVPINPDDIIE